LLALSPGRLAQFEFANLADVARPGATPITHRVSDVSVTVDRVRKNNVLWEVHMRLRIDSDEAALESNRGWVFQNTTYMLDADGEVIDHLGFETTMQTEREMGFAFLFELPGEIDQYTWVYKSPAAISSVPVEYEITEIPLP
jgi:hypothetical protein